MLVDKIYRLCVHLRIQDQTRRDPTAHRSAQDSLWEGFRMAHSLAGKRGLET